MQAGRPSVRVGWMAALLGLVVATTISVGVRLDRGRAPGAPLRPFARLQGRPAPVFDLPELRGGRVRVPGTEGSSGQMVYFVRSGCPACASSYPMLRQVAHQVEVVVVGTGARALLSAEWSGQAIPVPVGYDSLGRVVRGYGVVGFPSAVWIDRSGRVAYGAVGSRSLEQVLSWAGTRSGEKEEEDCSTCGSDLSAREEEAR